MQYGINPDKNLSRFGAVIPDEKRFPSCHGTPAQKLKTEDAGVHIYNRHGDQVFAGPGWVSIHARRDGAVELSLPSPARVVDAITGEHVGNNLSSVKLDMRRGTTKLFKVDYAVSDKSRKP